MRDFFHYICNMVSQSNPKVGLVSVGDFKLELALKSTKVFLKG
jgi:hypothetical protein